MNTPTTKKNTIFFIQTWRIFLFCTHQPWVSCIVWQRCCIQTAWQSKFRTRDHFQTIWSTWGMCFRRYSAWRKWYLFLRGRRRCLRQRRWNPRSKKNNQNVFSFAFKNTSLIHDFSSRNYFMQWLQLWWIVQCTFKDMEMLCWNFPQNPMLQVAQTQFLKLLLMLLLRSMSVKTHSQHRPALEPKHQKVHNVYYCAVTFFWPISCHTHWPLALLR